MQSKVMVNNQPLSIKEYKGQRVVTFKDIDAVHGRPDGTARKRFNDNKEHFIDGVDYHKITPSEFRTAIGSMDLRQQNDITLITESGYLMLVKSFTDDLAWEVQRELVNNYFRPLSARNCPINPDPAFTLLDFQHQTGVNSATAGYFVRNHCTVGEDYLTLKGEELTEYKLKNNHIPRRCKSLTLLKPSAIDKLSRYYKVSVTAEMPALTQKQASNRY